MGTNYYAEWQPVPIPTGPVVVFNPSPLIQLHICKSHRMFNGSVFNSWQAWKHFLEFAPGSITIRDEYGVEQGVGEFIRDVEAVSPELRRQQYDTVKTLFAHHPGDRDWLDADGFSFYRGEFS